MVTKETTPKPGSLKHAAAKIGCSVPTLYDLIEAGKLRSYHIGRAHRVSEQAIADCIALLERENQERAVVGTLPRTRFLGAKAANDGSLRTALTNVAWDKCA
jgi:excisionase family DNA binding protein